MDPRTFVFLIPVSAIICGTILMMQRMKLKMQQLERPARESTETLERLDSLEHELAGVKEELTNTQERLDFAERMLAKQKEPGRLGGPAQA